MGTLRASFSIKIFLLICSLLLEHLQIALKFAQKYKEYIGVKTHIVYIKNAPYVARPNRSRHIDETNLSFLTFTKLMFLKLIYDAVLNCTVLKRWA